MAEPGQAVVFVHGWSAHSTATYGRLPERLAAERPDLDIRHVYLARYITFRDEVRIDDLALAFEGAVRQELGPLLRDGRSFACITHSTGGPLIRHWWQRFYRSDRRRRCPMSHLVMLVPANFGSALAQLGKGRLARMKFLAGGREPGTGVLDWLELGSPEAWSLNAAWIASETPVTGRRPLFPFVLTGQTIDRAFYDHLNAYTGEMGSDGVVRAAAANLNAALLTLTQEPPGRDPAGPSRLAVSSLVRAPRTAFYLLPGCSHVGGARGIMNSVRLDGRPHPAVTAILQCLEVATPAAYDALCDAFDRATRRTLRRERVEVVPRPLLPDSVYLHDACSMVIFRIRDSAGHVPAAYDILLTGPGGDPDRLPKGFFVDRQRNRRDPGTVTYFLNHDVLTPTGPVRWTRDGRRTVLRKAQAGLSALGLRVTGHPGGGFVHYAPADWRPDARHVGALLRPHQTVLVDVRLHRIVRQGAARLTRDLSPRDFRDQPPGAPVGAAP